MIRNLVRSTEGVVSRAGFSAVAESNLEACRDEKTHFTLLCHDKGGMINTVCTVAKIDPRQADSTVGKDPDVMDKPS